MLWYTTLPRRAARKLKDADLDNLTPMAALELLRQIKAEL